MVSRLCVGLLMFVKILVHISSRLWNKVCRLNYSRISLHDFAGKMIFNARFTLIETLHKKALATEFSQKCCVWVFFRSRTS